MARNPYAPRRDYNTVGLIIIGGLVVALVAALAVQLMRPAQSEAQARASAQQISQMDATDKAYQARRDAADAQRRRTL